MGNRLIWMFTVIMLMLLSGCVESPEERVEDNVTLESLAIDTTDMSMLNDTKVFLGSKSSLSSSGWVTTFLNSKQYTGDIDIAYGFNSSQAQPTKARLYSPHNISVSHSYTCPTEYFNYTTSPKHFWCWRNVSDRDNQTNQSTGSHLELIYDHDFESGDIPTKTAYWTSLKHVDYRDITGIWTPLDYSHAGFDKWYYAKNLNVVAGKMYVMEFWLDIGWTGLEPNSGEYCIALKPSGETIQQAIANGHFYMLR